MSIVWIDNSVDVDWSTDVKPNQLWNSTQFYFHVLNIVQSNAKLQE